MRSLRDVVRLHENLESGRLPELRGNDIVEEIHRERYRIAATYCTGKKVLDIATGIGYGAHYLSTSGKASSVVGVDISSEAIAAAMNTYREANLNFREVQGDPIPFDEESFDVVVSLETIEHTGDPAAFLLDLKRVLKPKGTLVISTPNKRFHSWGKRRPWNPHHTVEFYPEEFRGSISNVFGTPTFWGGQEFLPLDIKTTLKHNWVEIQYYELRHHPTRKKVFEYMIKWKKAIIPQKTVGVGLGLMSQEEIDRRCKVTPWITGLEPYTMMAVCRKNPN